MSEKIKITFDRASTAPYKKLVNLQGDLKILTETNYQKIRSSILEHGFMEPISVWEDPDKELKILNGHQRLAAIKRMVEKEDYSVDELPINLIKAATLKEAKKKVLALTSEYGEMTSEGLTNFMLDMQMDAEELRSYISQTTNLKGMDMESIFANIAEIKVDIPSNDNLNIDTIIAGSPQPMPEPPREAGDPTEGNTSAPPRNDPDNGLRVLQVFLSDEQMAHAKELIDKVSAIHKCENISEAVLKALEIASEEKPVENNKPVTKKKSKA